MDGSSRGAKRYSALPKRIFVPQWEPWHNSHRHCTFGSRLGIDDKSLAKKTMLGEARPLAFCKPATLVSTVMSKKCPPCGDDPSEEPDPMEALLRKIQRLIREGKGQGCGRDYRPWLEVGSVPSHGRSSRPKGWRSQRPHQLLSSIETDYFYCLEWSDLVSDVQEQFPLLPLEETLEIAEACGVKHPTDPKTKLPVVMTTDFVITTAEGLASVRKARAVKQAKDLSDGRVMQKLDLERIYWKRRKVDWVRL